jgi:DNA-nicking Smr family endonuclease
MADQEHDKEDGFASFLSDAKPLSKHHHNVHQERPKPLKTPQHEHFDDYEVERIHLTDWDLEKTHVKSNQIISYKRCHLSKKQWRTFTQGLWRSSYCLDLHGLDRETAWEAVQAYVDDLYCTQQKYGMIVHGKGHYSEDGIAYIKNMLAQHLQRLPNILAYHSAMPKDGGAGALYVLIKSK